MLKVEKLSKHFGKNPAVSNVSFEIKPGQILSLIGPNGSGKTTIIKNIVGLLKPSAGKILISGNDINKNPIQAKACLGYIPDEPAIWASMTGLEFLNFSAVLFGRDKQQREKEIPRLLAIFGLNGIENEYFENYSRGNKQKLSILAALLHRPKVLLIDEPIVGLDPTSAEIAKRCFVKFAKEGGAVLMVTHTLSVAQEISSQIGVLKKGKLVALGTFNSLLKKCSLAQGSSLGQVYDVLAGNGK